jgi:hypothetical protein
MYDITREQCTKTYIWFKMSDVDINLDDMPDWFGHSYPTYTKRNPTRI